VITEYNDLLSDFHKNENSPEYGARSKVQRQKHIKEYKQDILTSIEKPGTKPATP